MHNKYKAKQKLISFSDSEEEFTKIQQELNEGWALVSIANYGKNFVGILEQIPNTANDEEGKIHIPPRKKIKISY